MKQKFLNVLIYNVCMQNFTAQLTKKKDLPDNVNLLHFELTPPQKLIFLPGQYMIMKVPNPSTTLNRLYSIASPCQETGSFDLLIKRLPGLAGKYVESLRVGNCVDFSGPAGVFTLKPTNLPKVFLVTGTGYAPVRSFILSNIPLKTPFHLYWGNTTYQNTYLLDELKGLHEANPYFSFTICLSRERELSVIPESDRGYFSLGHVNEAAEKLIRSSTPNSLEYYLCSGREIVESLRDYLYKQNIDKNLVVFERY